MLREKDHVELIHGEVIEKMPIGPSPGACVKRLNRLFTRLAQDNFIVSVQEPLGLGEYSEPQPDLALLRPRVDFYADAHPESTCGSRMTRGSGNVPASPFHLKKASLFNRKIVRCGTV